MTLLKRSFVGQLYVYKFYIYCAKVFSFTITKDYLKK